VQPRGSLPPLFCFPGMHGNAFSFYPLARALGDQQPTYAFTLPGVYADGEPVASSIKDLATQFLQDVRRVQPTGPYHLAGYSFGGYLAFEMAIQLAELGQANTNVIMFDTRGPGYPRPRSFFGRAQYHIRRAFSGGLSNSASYIFARFSQLREKTLAAEQETPILITAGRPNISAHSVILIRKYQPRKFNGPITLLRADEQPAWFDACVPDETMGWGNWADRVDVRRVSGTHITLLDRDRAAEVATALRPALA